jgi:hypothetical protein
MTDTDVPEITERLVKLFNQHSHSCPGHEYLKAQAVNDFRGAITTLLESVVYSDLEKEHAELELALVRVQAEFEAAKAFSHGLETGTNSKQQN